MQYYHDLVTQKSFNYLKELKNKYRFILIGGWAVFLYTRALKSKDIDIIVDYSELAKLKNDFAVVKNERLKKYEIKTGEFDIDIYLPQYSDLGIDIEEINKRPINKAGFIVPKLEVLFLLKLHAWRERRGSAKGQKDEIDLFSLVALPEFDWPAYKKLAADFKFADRYKLFLELLKKTVEADALGLNRQQFSKLKKNIFAKI
jgi:hypothetical protein